MIRTISRSALAILFVLSGFVNAGAQATSGPVKQKAVLAGQAYKDLKFSQAAELYEAIIREDKAGSADMLRNLADCYWQMRDYPDALRVYRQLYPNGKGDATSQEQFRIGELYARSGDYPQAALWLENIAGYTAKSKAYSSVSVAAWKADSLIWKVGYLGMNTAYREFCPFLENQTLLFSSNRPLAKKKKAFTWDGEAFSRLWQVPVSSLKETGTQPAQVQVEQVKAAKGKQTNVKRLAGVFEGSDTRASAKTQSAYLDVAYVKAAEGFTGQPVEGFQNIRYNSGGVAIDSLGDIYFSANYPKTNKKGDNRIRLMKGHYTGSAVENIEALPFGDPDVCSVMHPAINREGTVLIFSSDKPGGPGQYDLYCSTRSGRNQPWRAPFIITGTVNTPGNEVFPSITPDGYLYYSSDGRAGLGGLDVYRIKLKDAVTGTGEPEHLPYPVNSTGDDFGWTQTSDGKLVYFTSDRVSSEDNIYTVRYDEEAAKEAFLAKQPRSLEGFVLDRQTMDPIRGATVFILNKCDNKVYVVRTDAKGKYTYPVKEPCQLVVVGTSKGFGKDCLTMQTVLDKKSPELVQKAPHDLLLDRYTEGFKWRLSNIHYDFDKWNIRADARPILDSLVAILKAYPIKVELGSHTDSRGSFAYNDALSQRRAESAVNYIVSKGIDRNRITAKGYGERQLLNKCTDGAHCSEAEHQANRRTEIKVIQEVPQTFDPAVYDTGQPLSVDQLPSGLFEKCK